MEGTYFFFESITGPSEFGVLMGFFFVVVVGGIVIAITLAVRADVDKRFL